MSFSFSAPVCYLFANKSFTIKQPQVLGSNQLIEKIIVESLDIGLAVNKESMNADSGPSHFLLEWYNEGFAKLFGPSLIMNPKGTLKE